MKANIKRKIIFILDTLVVYDYALMAVLKLDDTELREQAKKFREKHCIPSGGLMSRYRKKDEE